MKIILLLRQAFSFGTQYQHNILFHFSSKKQSAHYEYIFQICEWVQSAFMSELIINTITAVVSVFALRKYYIVYGLVLIIESILMGNYNKKLQSNGIFAKVVSNRIGIRYCYSLSYAYFQTYLVFLRSCLNSNLISPLLKYK